MSGSGHSHGGSRSYSAFVKLHPQDFGVGLPRVFLTDPNVFEPVVRPQGLCWQWGLPEFDDSDDEDSPTPSCMMRRMTTQFMYGDLSSDPDFKETPEVQFVNVLMERKKAKLAAAPPVPESVDLELHVSLVRFGDDGMFELDPAVWRRVRISAALNLDMLHDRVLVPLMGWTRHYHGYFFTDPSDGAIWSPIKASDAGDMAHASMVVITALDPKDTKIGELLREPGVSKLMYTYDLGDQFKHILRLEKIITLDDGVTGKTAVLDGAMRCPNEDGRGCDIYQSEVLDVFNDAKAHPNDAQKQRALAKACWSRRTAVNVAIKPSIPGRFDPEEFSVEACQNAVLDAARSRASAQKGAKMFYHDPRAIFGSADADDLFSQWSQPGGSAAAGLIEHRRGVGQRVVATPVGPHTDVSEIINTKPDDRRDAVCAACGAPDTSAKQLLRCATCRCAWYCGPDCQRADWKRHKPQCKSEHRLKREYHAERDGGGAAAASSRSHVPAPTRAATTEAKLRHKQLRFTVGTRVECCLSVDPEEYAQGYIVQLRYREPGMARDAPYQVKLDDGRLIYAIADDDFAIRRI